MPYEVVSPTTREHLSFSQLATAAACGEAYRRKYIEGEEAFTWNLPALCGSAFHEAVETFEPLTEALSHEALQRNLPEFSEKLSSLAILCVERTMSHYGLCSEDLVQFGKQDLRYWCDTKLPTLATAYLTQRVTEMASGWGWALGDAAASIEVEVVATVGGRKFLGVIDQLVTDSEGRLVIRDLKTGKPKAGHALQLEQYRVCLERSLGLKADYGQILYINSATPHPQVVRFKLDDHDVDVMTGRQEKALGENIWLVNGPFSGACDWCDFRPTCAWGQVGVHGSS